MRPLIERDGSIPLLAPMSQIAGRLSIQEGAKYLEKPFGGSGVLLSGVPGTPKAKVVILGAGSVGTNACKIAVGMGADVTIMDINLKRLAYLDDIFWCTDPDTGKYRCGCGSSSFQCRSCDWLCIDSW